MKVEQGGGMLFIAILNIHVVITPLILKLTYTLMELLLANFCGIINGKLPEKN